MLHSWEASLMACASEPVTSLPSTASRQRHSLHLRQGAGAAGAAQQLAAAGGRGKVGRRCEGLFPGCYSLPAGYSRASLATHLLPAATPRPTWRPIASCGASPAPQETRYITESRCSSRNLCQRKSAKQMHPCQALLGSHEVGTFQLPASSITHAPQAAVSPPPAHSAPSLALRVP